MRICPSEGVSVLVGPGVEFVRGVVLSPGKWGEVFRRALVSEQAVH